MLAASPVSAQAPISRGAFREKKETSGPPEGFKGVTQKTPMKTNYFLPTGFTFPVRLENAIFSFNVETPAIAAVERDVVYQRRVVIPAGTGRIPANRTDAGLMVRDAPCVRSSP